MFLVESKSEVDQAWVPQHVESNPVESNPVEPDSDSNLRMTRYYELRDQAIQARDAGKLAEALRLCDEALDLAKLIGRDALIDQAYCNRHGCALALGQVDSSSPAQLRMILMRNGDNRRTLFTAAYHLACDYTVNKQHKKALFYAQIARQHAHALGNVGLIARSHNETGRCYMSDSYFDKAITELKTALDVLPGELSVTHTAPLGNLGYSLLLSGDLRTGFKYLYRALRRCRSNKTEREFQEWLHLYLCFGYIELRRWRYAWKHGRSGLELARENSNSDAIKSALYLLGEVEKSAGDVEAAHGYFTQLQREFYPENKELAKMMLLCETKDVVNLRA